MRNAFVFSSMMIVAVVACKDTKKSSDDDISSGRKPVATAGGTIGGGAAFVDDPAPNGLRLNSKEGGFVVDFPLDTPVPVEAPTPLDTAVGTLILHNFMHSTASETIGVSYSDYPAGHVAKSGGAASVLVYVQAGALTNMFADLDHASVITRDGCAGRDFTFSITKMKPAQYGRQLTLMRGDRLLQAIYLTAKGEKAVDEPRIRAFFDSFHVTR